MHTCIDLFFCFVLFLFLCLWFFAFVFDNLPWWDSRLAESELLCYCQRKPPLPPLPFSHPQFLPTFQSLNNFRLTQLFPSQSLLWFSHIDVPTFFMSWGQSPIFVSVHVAVSNERLAFDPPLLVSLSFGLPRLFFSSSFFFSKISIIKSVLNVLL